MPEKTLTAAQLKEAQARVRAQSRRAPELASMRSDFNRDGFRKVLTCLMYSALANVILVIFCGFLVARGTERVVIGTTTDGRIMPIIPLDQDSMPREEILRMAREAIEKTFTLTFVDSVLREQVQSLRLYYTKEGQRDVANQLVTGTFWKWIVDEKRTSSAALAPPILARDWLEDGVKHYEVQSVVKVKLENSTQNARVVTMRLQIFMKRMRSMDLKYDIGIYQVLSTPITTE